MHSPKFLIEKFLKNDPLDIDKKVKDKILVELFKFQLNFHIRNCNQYKNWFKKMNFKDPKKIFKLNEIPYLPNRVFKENILKSTNKFSKKILSSGTSGSRSSQIFIDQNTSYLQKLCLAKILTKYIGVKRRTFFVFDVDPMHTKVDFEISARTAGITGYLMGANKVVYLLESNPEKKVKFNSKKLNFFFSELKKSPCVIIGYTYMIWKYLVKEKLVKKSLKDINKKTKLIHFGGWKKLNQKKVSKKFFNSEILKVLNIPIDSVLDIYGFTEQLGNVYVSEGNSGKRVGSYAHVIIRDINTLEEVEDGKSGFIQCLSPLSLSYPGFSILNDDIGKIVKRENRKDTEILEFEIQDRVENLEPRGCGDTLPSNYYE